MNAINLHLDHQLFNRFADLLYDEAGIRIHPEKTNFLVNRLKRKLNELELENFDAYYRYLMQHQETELPSFIDLVTTNETFFFRAPKHFNFLVKEVLPGLNPLNISMWSAACSNGSEAYSLAITLYENMKGLSLENLNLFASDIDKNSLKMADQGIYNKYALRLAKPEFLEKYFTPLKHDEFRVKPILRQSIKLGHHNLMETFNKRKMDVIFCRNVLIYFDQMSKTKAISNLIDVLKPGGYLFVGESEIISDHPDIERIETTICRKKRAHY